MALNVGFVNGECSEESKREFCVKSVTLAIIIDAHKYLEEVLN